MTQLQPVFSARRMEYETPRDGITIGGYIARRLHKTILLKSVPELLKNDSARALAQIAIYAAAASTSFGPAMYQPDGDPAGKVIETVDPETDAQVTVKCEGNLRFSYCVEMKNVGTLDGAEIIQGTTVGWRGLGMPAPTTFDFVAESIDYRAKMIGLITSELGPGLGRWKIRGYGALDVSDNLGNRGKLTLDRPGIIVVSISTVDGHSITLKERLV